MSDDRSTAAPEAPDVDLTAPAVPSVPSAGGWVPSAPAVAGDAASLGFMARGGPAPGPAPSVPGSAGYAREVAALAPGQFRRDEAVRRYASTARSPLPYLAVAGVAFLVALVAVRSYLSSDGGPSDGGPSTYQWDLIRGALFGLDGPSNAGVGGASGWWAVAALAAAAVAVVVWLCRLGANARFGNGNFGPALVLLAVPSWYLWVQLIDNNDVARDFDESRVRMVLLTLLMIAQALGVRWLFTHRLWRSGRLPHPEASFVLWVPNLVASFLVFGALSWSYLTVEPGSGDEPSWLPTDTTLRMAQWSSRATGAAVVLLALVITYLQHRGIARDRAEHEVSTSQLRSNMAPPPDVHQAHSLVGGPHARP